jgi:hypothetical protein
LSASNVTTPWTIGSQAAAILSAEDLGLVGATESRRRLHLVIDSVMAMSPSPDGRLGRRYDARCLTPLNEQGRRTSEVSTAAPDEVSRLAGTLAIAVQRHPVLAAEGRPLLDRLMPCDRAAAPSVARPGFGRYALRAFALTGVALPPPTMGGAIVEGVIVPCVVGAGNSCVAASDAVLLEALEFGIDPASETALRAIFEALRRHSLRADRVLAPAGEDLRRRPWLRTTLVVADGVEWAVWPRDTPAPSQLLTTKGAFGWSVLFDDPFARSMRLALDERVDAESGWRFGLSDGRWTGDASADTNALVLEAVAYATRGPLAPGATR